MRNAAIALVAIICVGLPATTHADKDRSSEVLIIPLTGKIRGKLRKAPQAFTRLLAELAESSGTRAMSARVAKSDITTLVGCGVESEACYAEVATTLGVNELIFGKISLGEDGKLEVTLTRVRPNSASKPRTHTFVVDGKTLPAVEKDFEAKASKFLAEREVEKPDGVKPKLPKKIPGANKASFSFKRVKGYTWGLAIGGAGAIILGGVLMALASSKQSEVDDAATDSVDDLNRLEDLENTGKTLNLLSNSLLILGVVAAATSAALMYMQGSAKPTQERAVTFGPADRHGGFAVRLSGRF